jgi:o-succinylbenzoate---CoA ligase
VKAPDTRHETPDPVSFWGAAQPSRPALRYAGETWSYSELALAVSESAHALTEAGIERGEPVSVECAKGDAFAIAFHALHRVGAVPVPIGTRLTEAERQTLRDRARVNFTLEPGSVPSRSRPSAPSRSAASGPARARDLRDPAAIVFTSGSDGDPRPVLLAHRAYFWSALASARNLGVRSGDVWLACMPLHHVGGHSILLRAVYYGITALLHDRFDPEAVVEAIDRDGVTLISLVPPMLERLLEARGGRPFPATLRAALIGGGPAPQALFEEAAAAGLRALPTYGLTEAASQVSTLPPGEWPRGLGTAGRPLPYVRVEVRDAEDRPAGPGAEGEIVVRGPVVMLGYLDDFLDRRDSLDQGWVRTGDIGAWDEAGRLIVLDRRSDRIVTGGENVSPAEVEHVLAEHPAVREVCVIGIPSGAWGEEVVAVMTLREGQHVTLDAIRAHTEERLAGFKLPRRLAIADELPRGASGKLLRRVVRRRLLDEVGSEDRS